MLRRVATLLLLVPLSLNGLWMVCADAESAAKQASVSTGPHADEAECDQMCPLHQPETGAICLISSSGEGASLGAIFFAVGPPPVAESLAAVFVVRNSAPEQSSHYSSPTLAGTTPPPEA